MSAIDIRLGSDALRHIRVVRVALELCLLRLTDYFLRPIFLPNLLVCLDELFHRGDTWVSWVTTQVKELT